jgi:CRISPR-associated protein Cmr5
MPDPKNTRKQKRAQTAYQCVNSKSGEPKERKENYARIAKKFPALIHSCGLAQTIAFIDAKEEGTGKTYLKHLATVMEMAHNENLGQKSRDAPLIEYQHLSREAIESATWIKRYAEILLEQD